MLNKKALHWAVVAALGGLASVEAGAVTTYGSELPAGSALAGTTWTVGTTNYAPTTANPLYLVFTLTGGASYIGGPSMTCSATTGGAGFGNINTGFIQLAAGGPGTAVATFVVTSVSAGALISSCTITTNTALVNTWPASVGSNVSLTYGNALAPTGSNSTALATAASFFTNGQTLDTNTALVASGFVSFASATNTATTPTLARLGRFNIALNATLQETGAAANTLLPSAFVTALTISVAGPGLVASQNASGQVYVTFISAAPATDSAWCAGTKVVSAFGGTSAITFSAIATPAQTAGGGNFAVCMTVTGGTPIPAGDITVGVTGTPNADGNHSTPTTPYQISSLIASGTKIGTITRNGSATTVLNLPRLGEADAASLRIYNTSTQAGAVAATVWSQGATPAATTALVTNCQLTASLGANQALTLSAQQLNDAMVACLPGFTTPTSGRYRVDINGAFSSMRAQAFSRSNGTLTNISADSSTMGN